MNTTDLNLASILKGHVGETFFSPLYGDVTLKGISKDEMPSIWIKDMNNRSETLLDLYGKCAPEGELLLFPSRDQRDWSVWIEENKIATYEDIQRQTFRNKDYYWLNGDGHIKFQSKDDVNNHEYYHHVNGSTKKQLEKLLAINKLMNVQKWIEKGWQPTYNNGNYVLYIDLDGIVKVGCVTRPNYLDIYFSSESNVRKAIEILGEDVIRQALSTDW